MKLMKKGLQKFFCFLLIAGILLGCIACGGMTAAPAEEPQSAAEDLQSAAEDLQSIEEEPQSAAEDLQSAAEEEQDSSSETEGILTAPMDPVQPDGSSYEESAPESEVSSAAEDESGDDYYAEGAGSVTEDGEYTSKEEVAEYIHLFGHLPDNYITKREAEDLGWVSSKGNLWKVAPGKSIGGSRFGNYEGLLPDKKGRKYYECDIDFDGSYRGPERIIYSNDGLIYYTADHYKTFEQLYG